MSSDPSHTKNKHVTPRVNGRKLVFSTSFIAFVMLMMPVYTARAQNPVIDLAATGISGIGGGINSCVQTIINTAGASAGLLGALLAIIWSALNGIVSLCASSGISAIVTFPVSIIASAITSVFSVVIMVVINLISMLPIGGVVSELTSLVDVCRAVPTACVAPLNLAIALLWIAVQVVLDAVMCVGYAFQFCIYAPCSLIINIVLGGIYAVCGLCPVISVLPGGLFSLWQALNAMIVLIFSTFCILIPDVCLGMIGAIITAISNIYMPEGTKAMVASVMPALFHTATIALWDAMTYAIIVGAANLGLATWCGGVTGIGACLYGLISNFIHAMFGLVSFATFLFGSIISLAVSCLALPAILLSIQKNCCGV